MTMARTTRSSDRRNTDRGGVLTFSLLLLAALASSGCSAIIDVDYEAGCASDPNRPVGAVDILEAVSVRATCLYECPAGQHVNAGKICVNDCTTNACGAGGVCNTATQNCEYFSCYHMMQDYPNLPDGIYPMRRWDVDLAIPAGEAFCTGGYTYEGYGLVIGSHRDDLGLEYGLLDQLTATDLGDPEIQAMFQWEYSVDPSYPGLYNPRSGWTDGAACCFKSFYDGPDEIILGGQTIEAAETGGALACGGLYTKPSYYVAVNGSPASYPLPQDFFSSGVWAADMCSDGNNPAFLVRRYTGLGTCKEILDAGLSRGNGIYAVAPNGPFGNQYDVVCDMDAGGATIWQVAFAQQPDVDDLMGAGWTPLGVPELNDPMIQLALLLEHSRYAGLFSLSDYQPACEIVVDPNPANPQCLSNAGGRVGILAPNGVCDFADSNGVDPWPLSLDGLPLVGALPRDWFGGAVSTIGCTIAVVSYQVLMVDRSI